MATPSLVNIIGTCLMDLLLPPLPATNCRACQRLCLQNWCRKVLQHSIDHTCIKCLNGKKKEEEKSILFESVIFFSFFSQLYREALLLADSPNATPAQC